MKEDFLHYVWRYKKFATSGLKTHSGQEIVILQTGQFNTASGPDFFNARIRTDGQIWAGNVEMHVRSSDWYAHGHETDPAYDNVILHVVWEHDAEIYDAAQQPLPTLVLKSYVPDQLLKNYDALMKVKRSHINCEYAFADIDKWVKDHWFERLYMERLEQKTNHIYTLLSHCHNDWEAVLFRLLARYFGTKVNADAFESMAANTPFSVVRKSADDALRLEALFFGQSGLLDKDSTHAHFAALKNEYQYQSHKYQLDNRGVLRPQFFRLRPPNFPTIRLSQLAQLYHQNTVLFQSMVEAQKVETFYALLKVKASDFWDTHYHFEAPSKKSSKFLTRSFIDVLLINAVFPLLFAYAQKQEKANADKILHWMATLSPENNRFTQIFQNLQPVNNHALCSQALLQLYHEYCAKNRCLSCAFGNFLLK